MSGSAINDAPGSYGPKMVPVSIFYNQPHPCSCLLFLMMQLASNAPSSRENPGFAFDAAGFLWLIGGWGTGFLAE
jgi:hypothetical protein